MHATTLARRCPDPKDCNYDVPRMSLLGFSVNRSTLLCYYLNT